MSGMKLKSSTMKESRLSPLPSRQALASLRELQGKLLELGRVVFCGLCAYRSPIVDWAQFPHHVMINQARDHRRAPS